MQFCLSDSLPFLVKGSMFACGNMNLIKELKGVVIIRIEIKPKVMTVLTFLDVHPVI